MLPKEFSKSEIWTSLRDQLEICVPATGANLNQYLVKFDLCISVSP